MDIITIYLTAHALFCKKKNHSSCYKHLQFVSEAAKALVISRCVTIFSRDEMIMCSPLGVVEQKKLRLILDLCELNHYL